MGTELDQLKMFCEWEREYNARPGKTHIAEWALREIERQHALLEEMAGAMRAAVLQNYHGMLMTGEEIRRCEAALAKWEASK